MALAQSRGLELVTLDIKDAYLNVPQKAKATIQVDAALFGMLCGGLITFALERLLPGRRIAASEWFVFIKGILVEAGLRGFEKEPTLFRAEVKDDDSNLVLHADDGLLASTAETRKQLVAKLGKRVKVQVSEPTKDVGDELEFLKRRYVKVENGIIMYSDRRHLERLLEALGNIKERDAPVDQTFLDADSDVLPASKAPVFKECVGRLLYLPQPH